MPVYHYIGYVTGPTVEPVLIEGGLGVHGTVTTPLHACEDCGAVVPEGRGQEVHDRFHTKLMFASGVF